MSVRWSWSLAALLGSLLLGACASSPPSTFYVLTPLKLEASGPALDGGDLAVGLGPVTFPVFLDRPQIVSRETGNRLALDELHRWGGTVQDDFLRVWSENLAMLLGTSRILVFPNAVQYPLDFHLVADILAFERSAEGAALLKVRWSVLDPGSNRVLAVHERVYARAVAVPGDQNALVAALSETLADFSRDVAARLHDLPRPMAEAPEP